MGTRYPSHLSRALHLRKKLVHHIISLELHQGTLFKTIIIIIMIILMIIMIIIMIIMIKHALHAGTNDCLRPLLLC